MLFYTGEFPKNATKPQIVNAVPRTAKDMPAQPEAPQPPVVESAAEAPDEVDRSALAIRRIETTNLGKYVVELENGEIWRQLNSDNTPIALPADRSGLTAEIRTSFFGTTTVKISGTYRPFKATRVDPRA